MIPARLEPSFTSQSGARQKFLQDPLVCIAGETKGGRSKDPHKDTKGVRLPDRVEGKEESSHSSIT